MKLNGSTAACREGDSLDAHLFLRDGGAAGVARLPVARSTEDSRDAITRKAAVLELVRDEDVKSFVVHGGGLSVSIQAVRSCSWWLSLVHSSKQRMWK